MAKKKKTTVALLLIVLLAGSIGFFVDGGQVIQFNDAPYHATGV